MLRSRLINIIILIIGLFLIVNLTRSIIDLLKSGDRIKEAEEKVAQLRLKNEELKKKLVEVQSPFFLEKIAREKLGLAKEGEVVVILPLNPTQSVGSGQAQNETLPNWQKWLKLFF
ncbi:septum formation initiator family protein [Candidatus Gottesmanbacteria bacterium]|nr:septum formation initiator family protein [Candidatus Gottesmanbacteria bacterium]